MTFDQHISIIHVSLTLIQFSLGDIILKFSDSGMIGSDNCIVICKKSPYPTKEIGYGV